MSLSRLWLSCSLIACTSLVGCSGARNANQLPTKPIRVTVTYMGAPVGGATVTFINEGGTAPAYGLTDAQGLAKMKTYEEADGAVLGKHVVTIIKSEIVGPAVADQDSPAYVPPNENTPAPTVKNSIPLKYSNKESGLSAEVSASGPSEFKFELTD